MTSRNPRRSSICASVFGPSKRSFAQLFIATAILAGCGPITGPYLDAAHPETFLACPSTDIADPVEQAYEALFASLADDDWVIEASDKSRNTLTARRCIANPKLGDPLKQPLSECVVLRFDIGKDGAVAVHNPAEKRLHAVMEGYAKKWIKLLERTYAELRCYNKDELRKRRAEDAK